MDILTAVGCLVQASKEMDIANREMISEWVPDEVPPTLLMAEFARRFTASFDNISESERKIILKLLEYFIKEGDYTVRESVTTGFLEALLAESDSGRFDFSRIKTMVGKESRAYCRAWNRFTGVEMDIGDEDDNG